MNEKIDSSVQQTFQEFIYEKVVIFLSDRGGSLCLPPTITGLKTACPVGIRFSKDPEESSESPGILDYWISFVFSRLPIQEMNLVLFGPIKGKSTNCEGGREGGVKIVVSWWISTFICIGELYCFHVKCTQWFFAALSLTKTDLDTFVCWIKSFIIIKY